MSDQELTGQEFAEKLSLAALAVLLRYRERKKDHPMITNERESLIYDQLALQSAERAARASADIVEALDQGSDYRTLNVARAIVEHAVYDLPEWAHTMLVETALEGEWRERETS